MQSLLVGGRSDQLQFEYRGLRSNLQERFKGDNHRRLPCVILSFPCGSTSQGSQRKREAVGGGRPRVKDLSQMRMIKRQDKKKRERRKGTKRTKRRSALARRLRRGEKSQEGKVWRGGKGAKKRKKNKKKGPERRSMVEFVNLQYEPLMAATKKGPGPNGPISAN